MRRPALSLIFVLLIVTTAWAQAICPLNGQTMTPQKVKSFESLKRLPLLESGRVKPLDTYARNILLQFCGRQTFERKPAIEWLAQLLFASDTTRNDKVFLINNPQIPTELGLTVEKHRRYSFAQLEKKVEKLSDLARAASQIPEKERDVTDNELIRVFVNLQLYMDLSHAFGFVFSADDFSIKDENAVARLGLPKGETQFSFLDIALVADSVRQVMDKVQNKPSAQWTLEEKAIIGVLSNLFHWSQTYKDLPFQILPMGDAASTWLSPWDAIGQGFQSDDVRNEVNDLRNMVVSYWNGEQIQFDMNARLYLNSIKPRLGDHPDETISKLDLELLYNKGDFFLYSKMFYFFAFVFFLCSLINFNVIPAKAGIQGMPASAGMTERSLWHKLGFGFVIAGFVPHAVALLMRIAILNRPPVTNLYETFIFVGFVVVLLGLLIEFFNRNWLGIVTASVGGFALLMIASKYSAEGDTLKMLVAVLNSNFWLSTHVISITVGYGSACAAGILGHVYLLQAIFKNNDAKVLDSTHKTLIGMLGLALALTFLGTNLGGIWADQSWGRFWGWDPKENGALMIVIWTALLFHAKIARIIGPIGLAVGAVLGMIVVMWAWFGVNLLNIGLHSYGFTSGIAAALAVYVVCEIVFVSIVVFIIKKR